MKPWTFLVVVLTPVVGLVALGVETPSAEPAQEMIRAGFGETDITPKVGDKPVYMAGFGQDRKATKVHDPLMARAIVLRAGERKVALVSIDVVGFFHPNVERVRKQLPGFTYILVSSTHNHEGPDTLGLWGPNPFQSGLDQAYLKRVEDGIVAAIKKAEQALQPATARLGTARAPELLHDGREPYIKHDELVAVQFLDADGKKTAGLIVQWNCHPETLDSKNTRISADFVGATVKHLQDHFKCPVVYLTGTVGGLMTSLHVEVKDDKGVALKDGTFEKTVRYGQLVGKLAERALKDGEAVRLTPLQVRAREFFLPMDNDLYGLGWSLGVLDRTTYEWEGDPLMEPKKAKAIRSTAGLKKRLCIRSELAWLRLGDLDVACIPGEIYPELV